MKGKTMGKRKVKIPSLKLEEVVFNIDDELLDAFLYKEHAYHECGEAHDWREYGPVLTVQDSDESMIDVDNYTDEVIEFFDSMEWPIHTEPSTALYILGTKDVFMWVTPNSASEEFKNDLQKQFADFVKGSGATIFKEEIRNLIKRGMKHGIERDDIVKITNEVIVEEITNS